MSGEGRNGVREEKLRHKCDIDEEKKERASGEKINRYLREIEKGEDGYSSL